MLHASNVNEIKILKQDLEKKDKQISSMANLNRNLSEQIKKLKSVENNSTTNESTEKKEEAINK